MAVWAISDEERRLRRLCQHVRNSGQPDVIHLHWPSCPSPRHYLSVPPVSFYLSFLAPTPRACDSLPGLRCYTASLHHYVTHRNASSPQARRKLSARKQNPLLFFRRAEGFCNQQPIIAADIRRRRNQCRNVA